MLRNHADADDAFQAVFLVLARRAHALPLQGSLAAWLHGVAVRVCLNAVKTERRRKRKMHEAADMVESNERPRQLEKLRLVIDAELAALPRRLREALVLCDLEGRTRSQGAKSLSIPVSTLSSRVTRGREVLRKRFVREGFSIAAGGVAVALEKCGEAAPAVSAELVQATVRNAHTYLLGTEAAKAALGVKIHSLAQGVLNTMFLTKLSTTICILALAAALVLGATPVSSMLGLTSDARAQEFVPFLDDFGDGSETDGNPVRWLAGANTNGTSRVIDGDYVLGGTSISNWADGTDPFRDGSVQTQLRFLESINSTFAYVFARSPTAAAYAGGIRQDGLLMIVVASEDGEIEILNQLDTALNPTTRDVRLQFDTIGNRISFTAWHDGDAMPSQPQLVVFDDTLTFGGVGVGLAGGGGATQVAFRRVASVPEPTSVALGSLGFVALAAFGVRTRLIRLRSLR
jgi:RNA polymerase sigma factor (sigma-70 family)